MAILRRERCEVEAEIQAYRDERCDRPDCWCHSDYQPSNEELEQWFGEAGAEMPAAEPLTDSEVEAMFAHLGECDPFLGG